jgi:hypothetical protein
VYNHPVRNKLICLYCFFAIAGFVAVGKTQVKSTDAIAGVSSVNGTLPLLKISENKRFFTTSDGKPFFWLGDTGWLLFLKLNREEVEKYLEDRRQKGFNVIQIMVIHGVHEVNAYGDSALVGGDVARPMTTPGNTFGIKGQYDFWDHVDYVVDKAAQKGIYIAMVPVWGGNVKDGQVKEAQAKVFAKFLADRYKNHNNIIWIDGGDIKGTEGENVWKAIGNTLRANDPNHLITFHPRGRSTSSEWFHNEPWLDFNMFQSGHKDYAQDTMQPRIGEDNWKFSQNDYALKPTKPTLDGEPSYEMIPHGLHDILAPKWTANDVRRYAYWSVLSGGCGFTYGHNAIMQFYTPGNGVGAYGCREDWLTALNDPGAWQMVNVKTLVLSKPYSERVPDQTLIAAGQQGERYNYLVAARGNNYAFIYTYTGRNIPVVMGKISGKNVKASWFNPKNGKYDFIGKFANKGIQEFDPPGMVYEGNDWVLVLESVR